MSGRKIVEAAVQRLGEAPAAISPTKRMLPMVS